MKTIDILEAFRRRFERRLRRKIKFYIEMNQDSLKAIDREIEAKKIKQTLNPHEYSKYAIQKMDIIQDIKLLNELLK